MTVKTLFLVWQDSTTRRWFVIGRLQREHDLYQFNYVNEVREAQSAAHFVPLPSFPDLFRTYRSPELFPLFQNRVMRPSRPDYGDFMRLLALPESERDPMVILAKGGGGRITDTLEVFPCPEPDLNDPNGRYRIHFFVHGLRHMGEPNIRRAEELQTSEPLLLVHDLQNPYDEHALGLRTTQAQPGDMFFQGFLPRYLAEEFGRILCHDRYAVRVEVERVNGHPQPLQYRVLCRAFVNAHAGASMFTGEKYQPLQATSEAGERTLVPTGAST